MKRIYVMMLLLFLSFSFDAQAQETIKVVATIGQITDVVRKIGGERVSVQGLMGPGVDPHLYKASESDVRKLSKADIIFYNGINLEAKLGQILKNLKRSKEVVAVGETIPTELLLESLDYKGHYDPHIWFDVVLWIDVVKSVWATLAEYDPEHKQEYFERASTYIQELEQLHEYVQAKSQEIPEGQRVLVTAHDAFRYF
ncbi:MAG: zinc ABC transporter substrate-binding protein, partial [Candidatus Omnitrophica bacterium]|nr:zinc ABC transporter substrate-binding protein [Candidatus Omnitrophota bacterium]